MATPPEEDRATATVNMHVQVYQLTLLDRATLPHAQSTIALQ